MDGLRGRCSAGAAGKRLAGDAENAGSPLQQAERQPFSPARLILGGGAGPLRCSRIGCGFTSMAPWNWGVALAEKVLHHRRPSLGPEVPVATGDVLRVRCTAEVHEAVTDPVFGIIVRSNDGTYLYDTNTLWRRQGTGDLHLGDRLAVEIPLRLHLLPGRYVITLAVSRSDGKQIYDWHTDALAFDVVGEFVANGIVDLDGTIDVTRLPSG